MGNGTSGGPRMAISAMADMITMTKPQLIDLRSACLRRVKASSSKGQYKNPTISREDFRESMKEVNLDINDYDVLDHLYTMWDRYGDNKVHILFLLSGISPLASTLDVETKLLFAFELFDVKNSGRIEKSNARKILNGINSTASYFGDSVLDTQDIDIIMKDVFKDQSEIFYQEYMDLFSNHPSVIQFATAGGSMKYNT